LVLGCAVVSTAAAVDVRAQTPSSLYTDVRGHDVELRRELDLAPQLRAQPPGPASAALLRRLRATVGEYESIATRFPNSPYSDDALWRGGVLAADAFWQFGDGRDRATAFRLFTQLATQFPTSSLIKQIESQTGRLNSAQGPAPPSRLTAIRREVLPDALRITLELEREALFYDDRLDGPPRVFIDLLNTRAADSLKDATLAFAGDVVKQVRVGRQLDVRTRVVFDLVGSPRYSVYSLYNPYRLVVDFERPTPGGGAAVALTADGKLAPTADSKPAPAGEAGAPTNGNAIAPPAANGRGGFSLSRQLGLGVARIVIDPGHGGHDPGAMVPGMTEAELVLDVAQRLEKLLLKQPGVEVTLTRTDDSFVPLEQRTEMANHTGADLFLSIHANAHASPHVRGFETYFLNFAPNPEAEALAARENAAAARKMSSLPDIVKAIALNNKIDESRDFATFVQGSLTQRLKTFDRNSKSLGVKQAPFMVLVGATMPSVLAEISFMTNRQEGTLLKTPGYRQQIAEALFDGVMKYQRSLKAEPPVARSGF
jgi:N-acetylmuramoyl-L-alanine amidase